MNAKSNYCMKLMVLGSQNSGRTTLIARLQGKDIGNEATMGVQIIVWKYRLGLEKKFYFNI